MAHPTITENELLDKAADLFRTYGFEGVSLSRLSEATGLEKPSLYYRYPDGKDEIAKAAVAHVMQRFEDDVLAPLKSEASPRKRIGLMAERLRKFYGNGLKSCIVDVLSLPGASSELQATIKLSLRAWLNAFTDIARESGLSASLARSRAEEAIMRIEGALVMSRALGDTAPFLRCVKALPDLLTSAGEE